MKQIPNIEEIEHQTKAHISAVLGYLQQIRDSGQYHCAEMELGKVLENIELLTKNHHQQLQKKDARIKELEEELEELRDRVLEAMEEYDT